MMVTVTKLCARCGTTKSRADFGLHAKRKDGLQVYCKACMALLRAEKLYDRARWANNREAEQARYAEYFQQNASKLKQYWKEKARAQRQNNPGLKRSWNIARKHGERRATPPWAEIESINAIYQEARRLESIDGIKRHVDHIIPLKHVLVCGLHVRDNLLIMTAEENMSKHNSFEPG